MKLLIYTSIFLLAVLQMQQTLADPSFQIPKSEFEDDRKFLKPPTRKSYSLYDFFASTLNNYTMHKMLIYGQTFEHLLSAGTNYGASVHLDVETFMNTLRQHQHDSNNCELQRKLRAEFIPFSYKSNSSNENSRFYKDAIFMAETKISEQFPEFFKNFLDQFTVAAAHYFQSVDEEEVWKYNLEPPMLWGWSRNFMRATDILEKQTYFWFFAKRVVEVDEVWNVREKPDCKWDLKILKDFMKLCRREKIKS